jgi:S-formylglutathione hydrolase FrmB
VQLTVRRGVVSGRKGSINRDGSCKLRIGEFELPTRIRQKVPDGETTMLWCVLGLGFAPIGSSPQDVVVHDIVIQSKALAGNPLSDPSTRHVAVFRSSEFAGKRLPLVVYLPGFGGSSEEALKAPGMWQSILAKLHSKGLDVVLAVVDGRNRYGCSQYINSRGSGRYLDYICDEIVPQVEAAEHAGGQFAQRMVIGHSSGGFGALRIGMARQKQFMGVAGLSPDSYFDVTHKGFTLEPASAKLSPALVRSSAAPNFSKVDFGDAGYAVALCADYAGNVDGTFDWLYDDAGKYRPEVYERWRQQDPAVLAEAKHPYTSRQRVYLEGAAQDEFKANEGAAKVAQNLAGKGITMTTYFPPGHHGDHLVERIVRGVSWVFGRPVDEIK